MPTRVDELAGLIAYLSSQSAVTDLVGSKIYGQLPGGYKGETAILVIEEDGPQDDYVPIAICRFQLRCYGEGTETKVPLRVAYEVARAVIDVLHSVGPVPVTLSDGTAWLGKSKHIRGPSQVPEPLHDWTAVGVWFWQKWYDRLVT
jgi:hypothetical protein